MSSERSTYPAENPEIKEQEPEIRYIPVDYVSQIEDEDRINLLDLIKTIWDDRKILLIVVGLFTAIGLFNYLFGPTEYESSSVLIQETQPGGGGGTQQLLQRLGGFSFGNMGSSEVIPPALYPQIVYSLEFQRRLIFEKIEFDELGEITFYEYYNEHYEPPLTQKVYSTVGDLTFRLPITLYRGLRNGLGWLKGLFVEQPQDDVQPVIEQDERFLSLTREERRAIRELSGRVTIEMEERLITVRTHLPDPKAAAEINHLVVEQIQEYVIDYRIEKARQTLEFAIAQHAEAKERYDEAQRELANYSDQNVNLSTAIARTRLEDLQNQRNLQFDIYNSLSQQVEQARLKLQEETPVFNTLQRSNLPISPTGGSRLLLILTIILGVVFGVICIFTRRIFSVIRRHVEGGLVENQS